MMLIAGLQTAPDGSNAKLVGIIAAHSGSLADGDAAVRPLKAFGPPVMDARYVNYLEADAVDPAAVAYGPNLGRLRELKTKWDPDNFFRQNVNILPRARGTA